MIYDDDKTEPALESLMFPVQKTNVYFKADNGSTVCIPGKKALINSDTRQVLSVVSNGYRLLRNSEALKLAKRCCILAFPNTAPANWNVFSIEAPLTRTYCRIDLKHKGMIEGDGWPFDQNDGSGYEPFLRVNNSYNTKCAFSIRFGIIRWVCKNGLVDWDSSISIKVNHDVKDIVEKIEAEMNEAKFKMVINDYGDKFEALKKIKVTKDQFLPIVLSVLKIQKPKDMPDDREDDWSWIKGEILGKVNTYVDILDQTGYALINTITDIATRPPTQVGRYNFIRRERDMLQRLAGIWLTDFVKLARNKDKLDEYLKNPGKRLRVS